MRSAIVTGAASGIGAAVARHLDRDGYGVTLVDRDRAGIEAVASALEGDALTVEFDLAAGHSFNAVADATIERFGTIDVLVNNAGIGHAADVTETTDAQWDETIAVNLTAAFHTCRVVIPHMITAGGGSIVNVSSAAGLVGIARRAAYCASKAGLIGLTRAIAVDHAAAGIRANAVCPGTVDSPWIARILADADDAAAARSLMEQRQLAGRLGTPDEVAAAICFLAGESASFVNGTAFVVDGGMTAR